MNRRWHILVSVTVAVISIWIKVSSFVFVHVKQATIPCFINVCQTNVYFTKHVALHGIVHMWYRRNTVFRTDADLNGPNFMNITYSMQHSLHIQAGKYFAFNIWLHCYWVRPACFFIDVDLPVIHANVLHQCYAKCYPDSELCRYVLLNIHYN